MGRVPDQGVGQSSDTAAYYSGTSVGETFLRVFGSTLSGFRLFQNIPVKLLLYLLYTFFLPINLRLSYLQFVRLNTANPILTNAKNRPSPNQVMMSLHHYPLSKSQPTLDNGVAVESYRGIARMATKARGQPAIPTQLTNCVHGGMRTKEPPGVVPGD